LLPAFAKVRAQHPKSLLVIAGSGDSDYLQSLKATAADLLLTEHILWTGFLSGQEKLSALSAAALFVLPSYSENFGLALVEALAAGLPCITTDRVALSSDLRDRNAGMVISPETSSLTSALCRLLDDEPLRSQLSRNARRLASERFSLQAMALALKALYDQLLTCSRKLPR